MSTRALGIAARIVATLSLVGALAWLVERGLAFDVGGSHYEVLAPSMLFLFALAPYFVFVAGRSLADLPRAQRVVGIGVRLVLLACLALAAARLSRTTDATRVSVVYLVDVSESITDAALERARGAVERAYRERGENDVQLVAFAREARVVPIPAGATELPPIPRATGDAARATDLQRALQLAYGLFPPGYLRRVVLVSDGRPTHGDFLGEVDRATRLGVRVSHLTPDDTLPPEVAVRTLRLPEPIEVGKPFAARIEIVATRPTRARVRLYQGATLNGLDGIRDVDLPAGETEIELRSVVRVPGPITYRATVEPEGDDRFATNNTYELTTVVPGRPQVLYVEGASGRAEPLARALTAAELDVDVRAPRGMPSDAAELRRFDFVILSDTPADEVSLAQVAALERYVRDGGAFMMAGGAQGFGLGGWQGTQMERLLPVRMDAERRRDQPTLALALVIDRSGSMNGQKIELAKEAAKATAEMLGPDDYIEVVGFDSRPERIVRMQSAANRLTILRDIARLTPRGGTAIFPALDMAYQDLSVTRARVKHVILLTDGQSPEQGITEVTQVMRSEGITVTTVGLGDDVNRTLLQTVAQLGGGRSYFTNDPHHVPRIFMRETSTVARSAVVEEYFQPVVVAPADFLRGIDLGSAPYLRGYVATRERPAPAQVVLRSDLGEPLLARWRVGLGWSLAWTSDVKARWSVDWIRWRGFSQFWAQLVREHMQKSHREELPMTARLDGDRLRVSVDAIDDEDRFLNGLDSELVIDGPLGGTGAPPSRTVPMPQTAPGRYEAEAPLVGQGSFLLRALHRRDGRLVAESHARVSRPYPAELASLEPDLGPLREAAAISGGLVDPDPAAVFDRRGERVPSHEPCWPALVGAAIALFLLDLLLRRVRILDRDFHAARMPPVRRIRA